MKIQKGGVLGLFFVSALTVAATQSNEHRLGFTAASQEATRLARTPEGYAYMNKFADAADRSISAALKACIGVSKETARFDVLFVVSASGRIEQVFATPGSPVAPVFVRNFKLISVPPPPHVPWYQAMGFVVKVDPKPGPPDRPTRLTGADQTANYERMIAPYEKRGRATYPAAKQKFLHGLPPDYRFSVRVRFYDSKNRAHYEDAFVHVDAIKNGKIDGRIVVKMGVVTERKEGERVVIPESEVRDWLILRSDGTEEGNYVGKFLDRQLRR
jgi:hypothetical protein